VAKKEIKLPMKNSTILKSLRERLACWENKTVSPPDWLLVLAGFVFLRNFLEAVLSDGNILTDQNIYFFFFRSFASYLFFFLGLSLILSWITQEKIEKISRIVLFFIPVILLPPVVNLLLAGNKTSLAGYLPESWCISILTMLFLIGYALVKTKHVPRLLGGVILLLFCLSVFIYLPRLLMALLVHNTAASTVPLLNPYFGWDQFLFSSYLILLLPLGCAWYYFFDKRKLLAVVKNFRFFRIVHFALLLSFGITVGLTVRFEKTSLDFYHLPLLPADWLLMAVAYIGVFFHWFWAVGFNDIADLESDRVSAPERPLPSGTITEKEARALNLIFLATSLMAALVVNYIFFILILLCTCLHYLYSTRAIHLKAIPLLSNFVLAAVYFLVVLAGYDLVSNGLIAFPPGLILLLAVFTFGGTFKDIKDYEGDRRVEVKTLPVVFGLERSKKIIGAFGLVVFPLTLAAFSPLYPALYLSALLFGGLFFLAVNKKPYNESLVFLTDFSFFFLLALFLGFGWIQL
jgi:geranylgeranylglycerol-phosphate geranylgeranyltransferase